MRYMFRNPPPDRIPKPYEPYQPKMIPNIYYGLLVNSRISSLIHNTIAVPLPTHTQPPKYRLVEYEDGFKMYVQIRL